MQTEIEDEGQDNQITAAPDFSADALYQPPTQATPLTTSPATSFRPDSRQLVKWIAGALAIILTAVIFFTWLRNREPETRQAAAPVIGTIAVLPFKVLGVQKDDEYLSLGLADALITTLSQTRQVIVRQTETISKYQINGKDPLEAGREQGVEPCLMGRCSALVTACA